LALVDPRHVINPAIAKQAAKAPKPRVPQTKRNYRPLEIIREPVFWLMYLIFVLVGSGGLMAVAQLAPIAKDFKIGDTPVSILGLTLPALTFALTIDRVLNGITRPFFGWVSDNIVRELTMFFAFSIEGVGIMCLYQFGSNLVAFVILSGLVFRVGEIYSSSRRPTRMFGTEFAAANAGLLYTQNGVFAGTPVERAGRGHG
jgi:OFA family oxalate/formate antiporter-like MFS transporter